MIAMSKIIVMIGQPGAGKGTQARLLSEKFGYPQISTGDMLREIARTDSPLGLELKQIMNSGKLVSDEILTEVLLARTSREDCRRGYILDGYPRTLTQAHLLEQMAERQKKSIMLISVAVDEEILLKRLTGRLTCSQCGEIYNIYFCPPNVEGICNLDGAELRKRGDDTPEAVAQRLAAYQASTAPLIAYYRQSGRLIEVDGGQPVNDVFKQVCSSLEGQQVTA